MFVSRLCFPLGVYSHGEAHSFHCLSLMVISKRMSVLLSEELIIQKVLFKFVS